MKPEQRDTSWYKFIGLYGNVFLTFWAFIKVWKWSFACSSSYLMMSSTPTGPKKRATFRIVLLAWLGLLGHLRVEVKINPLFYCKCFKINSELSSRLMAPDQSRIRCDSGGLFLQKLQSAPNSLAGAISRSCLLAFVTQHLEACDTCNT